jgi:hypothetical protein
MRGAGVSCLGLLLARGLFRPMLAIRRVRALIA